MIRCATNKDENVQARSCFSAQRLVEEYFHSLEVMFKFL